MNDPPDDRPAGAASDEPTVAVVADDPLARTGLAMLVGAQGAVVVAQLAALEDLASATEGLGADAVLWDLGADAAAVGERLAELDAGAPGAPTPPLLALIPDDAHAADVLAAGARAVLLRDVDGAALGVALRAVTRGLVVLEPALLAAVAPAESARAGASSSSSSSGAGAARPSEELTARESQVLQLLAAGLANKAIAQRLGISDHTVKFHVNAILAKLGVASRTEAVVRAARLGLVIL